MKVWNRAGIELATPGSAVSFASVTRHVTDCATRPGKCLAYMNKFARVDENPAMTFQDIKETKRYGWTDGRTYGHMHAWMDNVKTVYPPQSLRGV